MGAEQNRGVVRCVVARCALGAVCRGVPKTDVLHVAIGNGAIGHGGKLWLGAPAAAFGLLVVVEVEGTNSAVQVVVLRTTVEAIERAETTEGWCVLP